MLFIMFNYKFLLSTRIILTVKIAHNNFFAFFEDQFAFFFEDLTYLSVPRRYCDNLANMLKIFLNALTS